MTIVDLRTCMLVVSTMLFGCTAPPELERTKDACQERHLVPMATQRDRDQLLRWSDAQGHLAIVIDDVGRDLPTFERLFELPFPLTFSVLPRAKYASLVQERILQRRDRPREIFLHLPMQPLEHQAMLEGAELDERFLLVDDSPEVLRDKVEMALRAVPAAVGVNNHMGSRLTAHAEAMAIVMEALAAEDLMFLDSRTHASSAAEQVARSRGLRVGARHVFLDNDPTPEAIAARLEEAAAWSLREPVIAIGHPSLALADVLRRRLPLLREKRVGVYPVSLVIGAQMTQRAP